MDRLCERPGCSETASVAYGMKPEDLVFWLDTLGEAKDTGVLCLRHADSMVVPRGWTLDDLRDPDLHLFRPPPAGDIARSRTPRTRMGRSPGGEQLELGVEPVVTAGTASTQPAQPVHASMTPTSSCADAQDPVDPVDPIDAVSEPVAGPLPWAPSFDDDDDLDGLLSAHSPLLARAFRGADRHRSP